jgi:hypothetical protein
MTSACACAAHARALVQSTDACAHSARCDALGPSQRRPLLTGAQSTACAVTMQHNCATDRRRLRSLLEANSVEAHARADVPSPSRLFFSSAWLGGSADALPRPLRHFRADDAAHRWRARLRVSTLPVAGSQPCAQPAVQSVSRAQRSRTPPCVVTVVCAGTPWRCGRHSNGSQPCAGGRRTALSRATRAYRARARPATVRRARRRG